MFKPTISHDARGYELIPGRVVVLRRKDPDTYDYEDVGPMYFVQQSNGIEVEAFDDELSELEDD